MPQMTLADADLYEFNNPMKPESGSGHADFCDKCGAATEQQTRLRGFDRYGGWPRVEYRTVCPHRRHQWDGHHRSVWLWAMRKGADR